ncbi:unnamed protein product [Mytilus edulis]|uniref:Uncharacterized protein n=1 Tax=Mytilus edulis TaxID=6550 RepID=A0A8S3S6C1_MYTED|nr:unnamed protein product [Mytilus edulis]
MGQCNDKITTNQLVSLLDGLTKNGEDFKIFKHFKTLNRAFHRRVDKHKNTIFHYLVSLYNEDKRYKIYIEYFCENGMSLLQLKNCDDETAVDFASYLGRSEVIANVMCNTKCDKLFNQQDSFDGATRCWVLRKHNLFDSVKFNIKILLDQITFGEKKDYEQILQIIGKESEICRRSITGKRENKASPEDDLQKVSGKKKAYQVWMKI